MAAYENIYWWSNDGVRLHARDYPARDPVTATGRPAILCIPGLTRNARDFETAAERLSADWRVICVNLRGRGDSGYAKDPMTYVPLVYVQDIGKLLVEIECDRFVAIGTSLGGIVTMLLAGTVGDRLRGAVLNDIGPDVEPAGLARIRGYVGRSSSWPTWMHAARGIAEANAAIFPTYAIGDWLAMAKRLYRLTASGRIVLDYDMKIAEPFRVPGNEAGPDMWRALERLAGVPSLVVRGALSDVLSTATAERMVAALPGADLATVANTGHAPTLDEPEAAAAIDRLLARVAAEPVAG